MYEKARNDDISYTPSLLAGEWWNSPYGLSVGDVGLVVFDRTSYLILVSKKNDVDFCFISNSLAINENIFATVKYFY